MLAVLASDVHRAPLTHVRILGVLRLRSHAAAGEEGRGGRDVRRDVGPRIPLVVLRRERIRGGASGLRQQRHVIVQRPRGRWIRRRIRPWRVRRQLTAMRLLVLTETYPPDRGGMSE